MPIKGQVLIRQEGRCACGCGEKLGHWKNTEFDHVPALELRPWSEKEQDTEPPANDPDFIFAKRKECHHRKTFGTRATTKGSDIHEINRGKRLAEEERWHQAKMAEKAGVYMPPEGPSPKSFEACADQLNADARRIAGAIEPGEPTEIDGVLEELVYTRPQPRPRWPKRKFPKRVKPQKSTQET
jgi:hypothetical protein